MSLMERLEKQKALQADTQSPASAQAPAPADEYEALKQELHREVVEAVNRASPQPGLPEAAKEERLRTEIDALITNRGLNITRAARRRIVNDVYNDVVGLGPLEPLLNDPEITEVMVNGPKSVYVERKGRIDLTAVSFRDNEHVMNVINRIVSAMGRRIDEASPMVDARLPDGSRVNAVIPPIALGGPTVTIRKFPRKPLTAGDLIRFSSASPKMMSFLEACVRGRANILVTGGTGSGKTTLLNILSACIPDNERIITIEDAAELKLQQNHVVTLESRPANIEGTGQITIRDLVRNSLRMRPDRILVGEVRGGETLDMLQAMNTGHDGSLTTAHANSPRDVISRLETMVLMSGMEIPVRAIRGQIASALNLIVQEARLRDGSRKIVSITEVTGMEGETVTLQDLFVYRQEGVDAKGRVRGSFSATGIRPRFEGRLMENGVFLRDEWFQN